MTILVPCPACAGGVLWHADNHCQTCPDCLGRSQIPVDACTTCEGTGHDGQGTPCGDCAGTGLAGGQPAVDVLQKRASAATTRQGGLVWPDGYPWPPAAG